MAKKKGRKKRWIFITGIIVVIAAFMVLKGGNKDHATQVTTEKVQKRDITSLVSATGKISPELDVSITSEVSGEIIEIAVKEGQLVKKGDLLVKINADTLASQVRQQEAALESSKARAQANNVEMLRAKKVFEDQKKLFEENYISEDQLDEYESNYKSLEATYLAAEASIHQQEMALAEANEDLSKSVIYAPMNGTITNIAMEEGERVVGVGQYDGTQIMTLANMDVMEAHIDVAETDIINVKLGDKATVFVDAINDEEYAGEVTEIASSGDTENSGTAEQTTTFEVVIRLDTNDKRLRPEMTATADVATQTAIDVLAVPIQCVTVRDKKVIAQALNRQVSDDVKNLEYEATANSGKETPSQ